MATNNMGPYSDEVMDHFTNPRNMGEIENPSAVGEVGNPACGDMMKLFLKINDAGIIEEATFKTFGCGAAIASSSMTTELLRGTHLEAALKLTNQNIVDKLGGLPPAKIHCSVMAEEAVEMALKDYYKKIGKAESLVDDLKAEIKKERGE